MRPCLKNTLKNILKNSFLTIYAHQRKRFKRSTVLKHDSDLAESVGFLYTVEANEPQRTEAVLQAAKKLEISGKHVQVLGYLPSKHVEEPNSNFYFFTKEDINFFGKPKRKELSNFLKTQFEHLYHLDLISEPILDYVIASSNAKCKIGNFVAERSYLFEINFKGLVETDANDKFGSLIDKMLVYTKMLNV